MNPIVSRLERLSLFAGLKSDPAALEKIAGLIRAESFAAGTTIIREGEDGRAMYILNRGAVSVEKMTLAGDKFAVASLKDDLNVFFGEMALMDRDVRSASVLALTDVECYVIRQDDFERLCAAEPRIGLAVFREIAKALVARLRKTTADSALLIAALIREDETKANP